MKEGSLSKRELSGEAAPFKALFLSKLHLMITLCAAHHAHVGRLQVAAKLMSPLLLVLWREQHPEGHEQAMLRFDAQRSPEEAVALCFV